MRKEIYHLDLDILSLDEVKIDLLQTFSSGDAPFDSYIKNLAFEEKLNGEGVSYVVVNHNKDESMSVLAYFTLSTFAVHHKDRYDYEDDSIPIEEKREHFSPISSIIIKMFAVDEKYQDTYYKDVLIAAIIFNGIIRYIKLISTDVIGAKMITLCAVDTAVDFYNKNGFKMLPNGLTMFDFVDAQDNFPMYLALYKLDCLDEIKDKTA